MLVVWLTQLSKQLHSQHSVDEKEEYKQEPDIANLEEKRRLNLTQAGWEFLARLLTGSTSFGNN